MINAQLLAYFADRHVGFREQVANLFGQLGRVLSGPPTPVDRGLVAIGGMFGAACGLGAFGVFHCSD